MEWNIPRKCLQFKNKRAKLKICKEKDSKLQIQLIMQEKMESRQPLRNMKEMLRESPMQLPTSQNKLGLRPKVIN